MVWEVFKGNENEWQNNFLMHNGHYRQSYQWGTYKSRMKWKLLRLRKIDKDGKLNLVQITYKKCFFFCAAYIPGEILGSSINLDNEFRSKVLELTKSKILYIRMDSTKKNLSTEEQNLQFNFWRRPFFQKQIPKVAICNLEKNLEEIINSSSDGWKKNYRKSFKNFNNKAFHINITNKPSPKELVFISNIFTKNKKVYKPHSEEEFKFMIDMLKDNIFFCIAYDEMNEPIAYRGMIYFNDYAWDIAAATTEKGRNLLSSFYITIELIKKCKSLGIKKYNFGEMDKKNKKGVYHFKQGIAKNEYQISGEWEFSNFKLITIIANCFISFVLSNKIRKIIPFINDLKF